MTDVQLAEDGTGPAFKSAQSLLLFKLCAFLFGKHPFIVNAWTVIGAAIGKSRRVSTPETLRSPLPETY